MEVDSERNCGIVNDVGGCMEFSSDRVCLELRNGNILEMVAEDCVPLHLLLEALQYQQVHMELFDLAIDSQ